MDGTTYSLAFRPVLSYSLRFPFESNGLFINLEQSSVLVWAFFCSLLTILAVCCGFTIYDYACFHFLPTYLFLSQVYLTYFLMEHCVQRTCFRLGSNLCAVMPNLMCNLSRSTFQKTLAT